MPETPAAAVEFRGVEKQYGGLRPLRLSALQVPMAARVSLLGFDAATAETFVNLATGTALPETGDVIIEGASTRTLTDSAAWLTFVESFGIAGDRIVLLEGLTTAQNLAIPFTLEIDPMPEAAMASARRIAADVGLDEATLGATVAHLDPLGRARVRLARAIALDPRILLLEHPTASLPRSAVPAYAADVARIAKARRQAVIALTADEEFATLMGGRVLRWNPATGGLSEERGWRQWFGRRR